MRHSKEQILNLIGQLDSTKAQLLESETLEFKEWIRDTHRLYKMLAEYAVCFANHMGGTLVLGVRDSVIGIENALTGCGSYNISEMRSRIYESTDPKILVDIEELNVEAYGLTLLLVHIPQGIGIHTTTDGSAKIRVGRECKPLTGSLRIQKLHSMGLVDFTANTIVQLGIDAFDPEAVEKLMELVDTRSSAPSLRLNRKQRLEQLGITKTGVPTIAGLLVVGREEVLREQVPNHEIQYLRMRSTTEPEMRVIETRPLLLALEHIYQNININNQITPVRVNLIQYDIRDYPEETVREALLNAVLHRDYTTYGSVFVRHFPDRLEVTNPGNFVYGITPQNILWQDSRPRNRALAEILRRIGYVERAGVGVKRMFQTQLASGKLPPRFFEEGNTVRLVLYDGTVDAPFVRLIRKREQEQRPLGLEQLLVLSAFRRQREMSLSEANEVLQRDMTETRAILMQMVKEGLLESVGRGRGRAFRLSEAVYRLMGESVEYTRERGVASVRYPELVMEYVYQHGQVDNKTVRELLGVNIYEASRLLRMLVEQNRLERIGTRRGAFYKLKS